MSSSTTVIRPTLALLEIISVSSLFSGHGRVHVPLYKEVGVSAWPANVLLRRHIATASHISVGDCAVELNLLDLFLEMMHGLTAPKRT